MTTSGELFEQEFETWTPAQAKAFFRAGMVDDFFATDIGGDLWVLTLIVVSRQGRQMQVQLRTARELDPRKVRHFKTLDAAVRAAGEIGFDVRTIGIARIAQHSSHRPSKASRARDHRCMLPDAD
ncbi:hypothetical protein [Paraburkholderia caledonica]|uniref:hypothetical protein n=1 Tax=Paraburkholderia caledonica TaxID=134536 RepID=UPI000B48E238|nr:hypothetical protein BWU74_32725 [Burkholderia sp. Bk]